MKNLRQFILALLLCCTSGLAWAYDFEVDGIRYTISKCNTAVVTGIGWGAGNVSVIDIPQSVTYQEVALTVTTIGNSAFINRTGLTSVTIPNSVETIGKCAFMGCTGLTSVTIPNSVETIGGNAFNNCTGLTSVTIGNSVKKIGDDVFYGCTGLTSVYIHDIAAWCQIDFSYGYANPLVYAHNLYLNGNLITNLTIPNGVTSIGAYAFENCGNLTSVTIPNSVETIGKCAFMGCTGLTSVTIPNSVETIGESAFWGCTGLTSVTIPNSVETIEAGTFLGCTGLTSVTIPNSVETIGGNAFKNCTGLTSVTIGNSVKKIGYDVFYGCTGLTSVYIHDIAAWCQIDFSYSYANPLVYAHNLYLNGNLITNLTIPNGVTSIRAYAFKNCGNLTSVTIPNSITSIGEDAFAGTGLYNTTTQNKISYIDGWLVYVGFTWTTTLYIASGTRGIADSPFGSDDIWRHFREIEIPSSMKHISIDCLRNMNSLTNINVASGNTCYKSLNGVLYNYATDTLLLAPKCKEGSYSIPNSVKTIGSRAFEKCTDLTSVTIPNSVETIGESAFSGCTGLTSVTIPNSVETIGEYAFSRCEGLTSVTIPNSVETIGKYAFRGCTSLTSVTIPNSVETIGESAFSGCTGLTSVTIPNSVETIGESAFSGCTGLTSVTIPNSVTYLSGFNGCTGLTSVTIGNSVETIGKYAFSSCTGLTSITIGNSVEKIGEQAFFCCTGLTSITIGNSVETIGEKAFAGCTGLTNITIPIPNSLKEFGSSVFHNTNWSQNQSGDILYLGDICLGKKNEYYSSEINIKQGTRLIANYSFRNLNTSKIIISESVEIIGDCAFENSSGYSSLYLPKQVSYVGKKAFYNTKDLSYVVSFAETPPALGDSAFDTECTRLDVLCGKKNSYIASEWNMCFSSIEEGCFFHGVDLIEDYIGGTANISASEAKLGDEVLINVMVENGYALKSIKVYNPSDTTQTVRVYAKNGNKSTYTYAFIMPNFEVKVAVDIQMSGLGVSENDCDITTNIHPNPTNGFVTIEAENLHRVSVFNTLGQKVYETTASGNSMDCNLSGCGTGVYLMQIETANGIATKRVVVE